MATTTAKYERRARRRRWHQYGLRTLLRFTFLVAVCFAWVHHEINRHRQMQVVIATIGDLGGTVTLSKPTGPAWLRNWLGDKYFKEPLGIDLTQSWPRDANIDGLDIGLFRKLEHLDLSFNSVDDEWLVIVPN